MKRIWMLGLWESHWAGEYGADRYCEFDACEICARSLRAGTIACLEGHFDGWGFIMTPRVCMPLIADDWVEYDDAAAIKHALLTIEAIASGKAPYMLGYYVPLDDRSDVFGARPLLVPQPEQYQRTRRRYDR